MQPSLYAKYLTERIGDHILEVEHGFATYRYTDKENVYIIDIFVEREYRRDGIGTLMADKIVKEAKSKGCKFLLGSVVPTAKNSTDSMTALISYGMKIYSASDNFIVLKKEI